MKKTIILIFIFLISASSILASSENKKLTIHIEFDSTYLNMNKRDFYDVNVKIYPVKNLNKFQIAPIIASRSGIELGMNLHGTTSEIDIFENDDQKKLKDKFYSHNILLVNFKYFPGNANIPDFKIRRDFSNDPNVVSHGEKTRQSFTLGFSSRSLWGKSKPLHGAGLSTGLGFVIENKAHHYTSAGEEYGYNDTDVHMYFEVEPQWEIEQFIFGFNYNTYFHQFGVVTRYKF